LAGAARNNQTQKKETQNNFSKKINQLAKKQQLTYTNMNNKNKQNRVFQTLSPYYQPITFIL